MTDSQTVFIVDDNRRFLHSVQELLKSHRLLSKGFGSAEAFLDDFQPEQRGCLLLDVRLPKMSGLDLLEHLRHQGWMIPTIMMTSYGNIPKAVRAIRLGAIDFVEKPLSRKVDFISLIREAMDLESTAHRVRRDVAETSRRLETLFPRERETLDLLVESLSSREIADELGLSVRTVEHYRLGLMPKMNARSVGELVHMMVQHSVATQLNVLPERTTRRSPAESDPD